MRQRDGEWKTPIKASFVFQEIRLKPWDDERTWYFCTKANKGTSTGKTRSETAVHIAGSSGVGSWRHIKVHHHARRSPVLCATRPNRGGNKNKKKIENEGKNLISFHSSSRSYLREELFYDFSQECLRAGVRSRERRTHLLTNGSENAYRLSSTGTVDTTEGTICCCCGVTSS